MDDKSKVLLIVEDEEILRNVLKDTFQKENFIVYEADNGETGLQMAADHNPHIIILDLYMPKLDGMMMLKKLRESGEYGKNVKVIILTNLDADDKIIQDVVETEPTYYLLKTNIKPVDVIEKVKEILSSESS